MSITPDDVERAQRRIEGRVRETPVIRHGGLALKLECLQHAGSFKPRGAFNRVLAAGDLPGAGLVAASGGNHGAAVSFVGKVLGIPARVYLPKTSPAAKRANIARHGATVVVVEGYYDDAQAAANANQQETGALMVHPYDHADTVAGAGTLARELDHQLAGELDTVLVASGGGGLLAGVAAWFAGRVAVVSVEPETSQCVRAALAAGGPTDVTVAGVAADSLGAKRIGSVPWEVVRRHVARAVVVTDDAIRAAQRALWDELRIPAEPGGATAFAAVSSGVYVPAPRERVAVIVCGANGDPAFFAG